MNQALPAGPTRRRALFGLLDADGWGWASVKAVAWFVIIIFILGYIPDRAYYFTVNRTLDLGILAWSPVNFCPPENEDLPCPVPTGAIRPWHPASDAVPLPAPRAGGAAVQVTTTLLYVGGTDGQSAQATTYGAPIENGVIGTWSAGPDLPEARVDAAVAFFGGSIYVIGGHGPDGAPTATTYVLTPDTEAGELGEWTASEDLALPEARADAAIVALGDGLLLIGGDNADGPTATTWKAQFDEDSGMLQAWVQQPGQLATPTSGAGAAQVGDYVWLYGGRTPDGPTAIVQRGTLEVPAVEEGDAQAGAQVLATWDSHSAENPRNLPAPRVDAATWVSNGTLYLAGGTDGSAPQPQTYWAIPTSSGDIDEWLHLDQGDLPAGLANTATLAGGQNVFLIGGQTTDGIIGDIIQANLSPQEPFFQLGVVGATVPGLKVDGEIGQQLGYLNAAGAGTVAFIVLLLIGYAYNHKEQMRHLADRVRRRRSG